MKGNFMRLLLFCFLFIPLNLFAAWKQDEFIIGSFHQPEFTGDFATDTVTFKAYRDLGFNTLADHVLNHVQDPWNVQKGYLWFDIRPTDSIPEIDAVYRLNVLTHINGLKSFIIQRPIWTRIHSEIDQMANDFSIITPVYTAKMREKFAGYVVLPDEASPADLVNLVLPVVERIFINDPERPSLVNLAGNLAGNWSNNLDKDPVKNLTLNLENFRTNLNLYLGKTYTQVFSFDYYKFFSYYTPAGAKQGPVTGGANKHIFYKLLQIVAEETNGTGKVFWGDPLCAEHEVHEFSRKTIGDRWTPVADRKIQRLTPAHLRSEAFSFVIYNAKGILWYSYHYPNASNPPPISPWASNPLWGQSERYTNYPSNNSVIRDEVQKINLRLSRMGNVLLKLNWLTTVHGNSVDPEIDEPYLPVIKETTPVLYQKARIKAIEAGKDASRRWSDDSLAVGIFEDGKFNYLAVMNKSLINTNRSKYNVKGNVYPYISNRTTGTWDLMKRHYKKEPGLTSFELQIIPGDMELIWLGPEKTTPVSD
jgi:hypothetical protein